MKFLVVEDDLVSQEVLKSILLPHGQCEVANNGKVALDMIQAAWGTGENYDMIFLDIMMPVMDGQTTLREIRRLEDEKGIGGSDMAKVVMVTALEDAKNVMKAFVRGSCEAYITKPIYPKKIEETLAQFNMLQE